MSDLVVRFCEQSRYDVMQDEFVTRFMGITDKGTFHIETPCKDGKQTRELRAEFQDYVKMAMEQGADPHEVNL